MTVKEYAAKRKVSPQSVLAAIKRVAAGKRTLPYTSLPGIIMIKKVDNQYELIKAHAARISKGRSKIYQK